jgi:hypothetical protein
MGAVPDFLGYDNKDRPTFTFTAAYHVTPEILNR